MAREVFASEGNSAGTGARVGVRRHHRKFPREDRQVRRVCCAPKDHPDQYVDGACGGCGATQTAVRTGSA